MHGDIKTSGALSSLNMDKVMMWCTGVL